VQPSLRWGKPVVVLINERSFSDAEVFPYGFKQLGLGKVVGVPTAGGVIGTNDITLSDGSKFRIPRVGWYGLNGENLEHLGVKPDVLVEETPEDRIAGRDPQLAKALEVILAEVHPPKPADAAKPAEPKKPDAGKPTEAPKPTVPTPDLPKPTPPKAPETAVPPATPQPEAPKPEAPKPEAPKPVAPTAPESPKVPEAPKPAEPVKPVDAPKAPDAPKPVEAPKVEAPKASEAAASATAVPAPVAVDNPLYDAKVGEWVKVKITTRAGAEQTLLVTVVEVADDEVEVETTDASGTPGAPSRRRREVRAKELSFGPLERQGEDRKETLTVAGKDLACRVVTLKNRRGGLEERWYSNEVPGSGLVRRTVDGRVVSEVIEWGAETPKK
jgi:hypothetical protein